MKMKKRWLCGCMAALLIAGSVFTGCASSGGTSEDSKVEGSKAESSAAEESTTAESEKTKYTRDANGVPDLGGETISIWVPLAADELKWIQNYSEYDTMKNLQEKLNVKLEFIHPPVGQEQDSFSIMLNSGNWPDIISNAVDAYYPGKLNMALADKVMMPVDDYISDDYMPNFNRVILSDPERKKLFMNDEGQLIRFGSRLTTTEGEYGASCYIGPMIRKDYLKQAGMEAPETIEDWYKMLTAFKENGVKVPYGWANKGWDVTQGSNTFVSAYGLNNSFMVGTDGKVAFSPIQPAYKDYLTEMNKWYAEGLIDPDFATHSDADNVWPMLSNDETGAVAAHLATYVQNYYPVVSKDNPDKDLVPVQFPVLNKGDALSRFRDSYYGTSWDMVITTKAKNPDACVAFLDSMYAPEIFYTMYGTEGVTFERGDTGKYSVEPIWYPNNTELDMRRKHMSMFPRIDDNSAVPFYYSNPTQQDGFKLWNQSGYDGNLPVALSYTEDESNTVSKYMTDIQTFVDEMRLKFIVGSEPLDNFDKFVEQVRNMHIDELTAIHQASLERYNAR